MAVVLAVVGVVIVSGSSAYRIYQKNQAREVTKENIADVTNAIHGFLGQYSRYPCPAPLDAMQNDVARYGLETDCTDTSVAVGTCATGICIEERDAVIPGFGFPRVRRGAVPFRALSIFEKAAYDGYHRRLSYVVTEALAVSASFNSNFGGISVEDGAGNTVVEPADSAHFLVFSHGEDMKGAFTSGGVQASPCVGTDRDVENCNTGVGPDRKAVYTSMWHDKAGNDKYDDVMSYATEEERPLWRKTDTTGLNIRDMSDLGGTIAVGAPPVAGAGPKISLSGNVKSEEDVYATEICDATGATCFPSSKIAGDDPDMECPPGQYATRIQNSNINSSCVAEVANLCPSGSFFIGVNADMTPKCDSPPASCGLLNRRICGTNKVIPASGHNTNVIITAGSDYQETWLCRNGNWGRTARSGYCTCYAYDYIRTTSCGTGFTGNYQQRRVRTCPGRDTTYTNLPNTCACVGAPDQTTSRSCGTGYTGTQTRTRSFTCSSATTGSWGGWTGWSNTCTCAPNSQTQTLSCAAGETGSITRTRNWNCAANVGSWGNWTVTTNTCSCTPTTQTRSVDCAPDFVGAIVESRTNDCASGGAWGDWAETSNTCSPVTCSWQKSSTSSGASGSFTGKNVGSACTCGTPTEEACWEVTGGNKYFNYPKCSCLSDF